MPIQRALVGYDGTEHSERALQFSIGIDDDYETEIHLAFIVNNLPEWHVQYQILNGIENLMKINEVRSLTRTIEW